MSHPHTDNELNENLRNFMKKRVTRDFELCERYQMYDATGSCTLTPKFGPFSPDPQIRKQMIKNFYIENVISKYS